MLFTRSNLFCATIHTQIAKPYEIDSPTQKVLYANRKQASVRDTRNSISNNQIEYPLIMYQR